MKLGAGAKAGGGKAGSGAAGEAGAAAALVRGVLEQSVVSDVVAAQLGGAGAGLVRCQSTEDVLTAVERLAHAKVSCAPVVEAKGGALVGLLDFGDVVACLLRLDLDAFKEGEELWAALGQVPVSRAAGLSESNAVVEIAQGAPLAEAVRLIARRGARRCVVTAGGAARPGGAALAILSPRALVRHVMQGLRGRSDALLSRSVEELRCGRGPVNSVSKGAALVEAFSVMLEARQSVVAVVDPHTGALSGSISMSDIKSVFAARRWGMMTASCWKFIVDARERSDTEAFPFFGVLPSDRLSTVCSKLLATNVHHLYLVDSEAHKPLAVIGFVEICTTLCEQLKL
jgi:CBS domain-containing protein